jgi:hypothetical protein
MNKIPGPENRIDRKALWLSEASAVPLARDKNFNSQDEPRLSLFGPLYRGKSMKCAGTAAS